MPPSFPPPSLSSAAKDASLLPSSVLVFHEDVPHQDWSSLFGVLEGEGSYVSSLPPSPAHCQRPRRGVGRVGAVHGEAERRLLPGVGSAGVEPGEEAATTALPRLPAFSAAIGRSFHRRLLPDRSLHISFR